MCTGDSYKKCFKLRAGFCDVRYGQVVFAVILLLAGIAFFIAQGPVAAGQVQQSDFTDINIREPENGAKPDSALPPEPFVYTWKKVIWGLCYLIATILFFARKAIVVKNGYSSFKLYNCINDHIHLAKIGKENPEKQKLYTIINVLIPLLFIIAIIMTFTLHL